MEETKKKPEKIGEFPMGQLVRDLSDACQCNQIKFAFLLGSGASVSSGIPAGGALVERWYQELVESYGAEALKDWEGSEEHLKGVSDPKRRAEFYSVIYQKRFGHNPELGYSALRQIMEGQDPSLGYFILSQIVAETKHNIVLTTNFDSLLEDSVRSYTAKIPFVAGHEQLAEHVATHEDRPIIIKLHRDLLLKPLNTEEETGCLADSWRETLAPILNTSHLIVLGYGGNDGSLMGFLEGVDVTRRKGIYWCIREGDELTDRIRGVLRSEHDRIVRIPDFDHFMYACAGLLRYKEKLEGVLKLDQKLSSISDIREHELMAPLVRRLGKIKRKLEELSQAKGGKGTESTVRGFLPEVYQTLLRASSEPDPSVAEGIYKQGLEEYPTSAIMLGAYAVFLQNILKDYDGAEDYYLKALDADPEHAGNLGNYALFLHNIRRKYDAAKGYYLKALVADPKHANNLGNYATFLHTILKDYDGAEDYYLKALDADPKHAGNLGAYAVFLHTIRKDYDGAKDYYLKAIAADPKHASNLGNYAFFLAEIREDYDGAEDYYLKALDADPKHAGNLGNYAVFLRTIRKDYDRAEDYFLKALDAEPNAVNLGAYALFLTVIREDYDRAEDYFLKALDADPKHAGVLEAYALFLAEIRKDYARAEGYHRKALAADHKDAGNLGN
jgi:tetratricopeptide (TPR) repeat protein